MNFGELFSTVAKPIGQVSDAVLGTNFKTCQGCLGQERDIKAGMSFLESTIKRMKGKYEVQSKH